VLKNEPIMAEKLQPEIRLASVGSLFPAWVCIMCDCVEIFGQFHFVHIY